MIRIYIAAVLILTLITGTAHADTAQYYNETSGQMEVPIWVVGGAGTENYISYCSLENTNCADTFDFVVDGDVVRRYSNGSWTSATYAVGVWWGAANIDPIEAGVGYQYVRTSAGGNTTWIYDTEFNCEEQKPLEEQLMEFGETIMLLMLLYLNHTSKKKNLLLVAASVTYVTYLTVYVNVNENMALIGFYILIIAYFVLSLLPQKGGK